MDIIIGGGITGLSYALFSNSSDYLIIEKDKSVGGYCKTTKRNGFVWDYSGHFFHFQDPQIKEIIMSGMTDETVNVVKHTRIKYGDKLIDYPFQKNIHQLDKEELIDCIYDLFTIPNRSYANFRDMLYCKFGKSIAEKFLIPYNSKLYACDLNQLDKDAMGRFFPYAEKEDIIRNFKASNNASYNDSFVYPRNGAFEYVKSIHRQLDHNKIRLQTGIKQISLGEHEVLLDSGEVMHYDRLISTIPFPTLLDLASVEYDKNIYTWNQVLVFNLGFDTKGANMDDHWLYFPDEKYSFYRVGFYDNILNHDKMSLYVELGFDKNAKINPEKWLDKVMSDLRIAGIVSQKQSLVDYESIIMNPAYVHINTRSVEEVEEKKAFLADNDVYSIGRYGSWCYCSIEDNIKEARSLADRLKSIKA